MNAAEVVIGVVDRKHVAVILELSNSFESAFVSRQTNYYEERFQNRWDEKVDPRSRMALSYR